MDELSRRYFKIINEKVKKENNYSEYIKQIIKENKKQ